MSKTALFTNFTDKEFIGYWNGKPMKFAAGQSQYMQDYLARHFAKHLTNRELLRVDAQGNAVYRNGEKFTSPKFPEQVPQFMELFNKAYIPDESGEDVKNEVDAEIEVINKNKVSEKQDPTEPQIVLPPDFEDNDDEEAFKGKPVEDTPSN